MYYNYSYVDQKCLNFYNVYNIRALSELKSGYMYFKITCILL